MSATWEAVVPLEAPRYRTPESSENGTSRPPAVRYAASLLLLGSHSRYSSAPERTSRSPYTLRPGQADLVYSLPRSSNTPSGPSGSMPLSRGTSY